MNGTLNDDASNAALAAPERPEAEAADDPSPPPAPQALGPGDDDPRSPVPVPVRVRTAPVELPAARAVTIPQALGPGDSVGENPDDAFHFLAPPPAGPGGTHSLRHLVRIPKNRVSVKE